MNENFKGYYMLKREGSDAIQGMPLGRGDATSPYTVSSNDTVVEFTEEGSVTCTMSTGTSDTTVLAGSRYAIGNGVKTITFSGTFNIG